MGKCFIAWVLALLGGFAHSAPARAEYFEWNGPWQSSVSQDGNGSGSGLFTPAPDRTWEGGATGSVTAFANGAQGFQSTSIDFTRSFTLSGSPQGWSVDLVTLLDGSLSVRRYGSATLYSAVGIVGQFDVPNSRSASRENLRVSTTQRGRYLLPDGRYGVRGEFLADVVAQGRRIKIAI